jgi:hypothetical protein
MKIYVLGDSFTDNLFKYEINAIKNGTHSEGQLNEYVKLIKSKNLPDPLYFEDYLKLWGHEVINLGQGGCSNESIFHQFTQIKKPFDRIIINWTGFVRFDWYCEKNIVRTFTGGMPPNSKLTTIDEILVEQGLNRERSQILKNRTLDFISFFVENYTNKKPIIWSPFENISKIIENQKRFIWNVKDPIFENIIPEYSRLEINEETSGKINDQHYGRYGNFYTALIFNTILEHTDDIEHDGYYTKDSELISKIEEKIKTTPHNIIEL